MIHTSTSYTEPSTQDNWTICCLRLASCMIKVEEVQKEERKTMSLKRFYFDRNIEICATCMFIDEYSLNVHDDGEAPHGYDGTAVCCKFDNNRKETVENRIRKFV